MTPDQQSRIELALGASVAATKPLHGGCLADVSAVQLTDGRSIVAKMGKSTDRLDIEGRSLQTLGREGGLPVPNVFLADDDLLVLERLRDDGDLGANAQIDAARHVAALHAVAQPFFGFTEDTRIGPLHQANPRSERWLPFFRDHRLLAMGRVALDRNRLALDIFRDLERFAEGLEGLIAEPDQPALLHGDLWTGNVLSYAGSITGFIDPAIYYGDPEMDLAFSTLFGTFEAPFFDAYRETRPFDFAGFMEVRRDIYNLYPLLVHTALFGGGYAGAVSRTLRRFVG